MKWIKFLLILFIFFPSCDVIFADGGRFIGDFWVSDSSLTSGNITFNGNVGIGTTLINAKLVVQGDGSATYTTLQARKPNGTPTFTIKDDGNVGIGSVSPQRLLDVVGSSVAINQTGSTGEILKMTCTQGALSTCSSYTTTTATKSGAFKVNLNNQDVWVPFYIDPN